MKAARIHAYGHADQIQVEDVAIPNPSSQEVLVRISVAGVNPVDWKIREGWFAAKGAPSPLPFTLGQDFAGEVIAVGEDVRGITAGGSVYGFANGAYAEYAVVAPDMISSRPVTIDETTAATLPTPGLTALQIVARVVQPRNGQTILIHGAAGSVGSIATQLCLASGARVIATASGDDASYLHGLGVAQVIDYRSERFEDKVRDVDAVIDVVGGDTLVRSFQVVKDGGAVITTVALPDPAKADRGIRATGIVMRRNAADLAELARLVDQGIVRPRAARGLPLADARQAQELSQSGRASEKLVLNITGR
jgi:NADPH:quinone reductase-like Zn-dependent oxidoreductase